MSNIWILLALPVIRDYNNLIIFQIEDEMSMHVTLQNLTKKFPGRGRKNPQEVIAVNDFSFVIPDGKLVGLLGPSGCGKSTMLNLLSGLLTPTEGKIFFGEDEVTNLPPEHRGVGLVFQNYALYPHLTVRENITFPLENRKGADKLTKKQMADMSLEAAKLVQLDGRMDRKPNELSGGQQQRGAIAGAVVKCPGFCCCTSLFPIWMPVCGFRPGKRSAAFRQKPVSPPSSSPTLRKRPCPSAI